VIKIATGKTFSLPLDGISEIKVPKAYLPIVFVPGSRIFRKKSLRFS
jgi:hypothetical protein